MKLLYFLYALKRTDYHKLLEFIKYVSETSKKSKIIIVLDFLKDFCRYNTLFLDYFYFRFFEKDSIEKETYIDTLSMFKFQKKFNNKKYIKYFADKSLFYQRFKHFVKHNTHTLENSEMFEYWISKNKPKGIVCKNRTGQVGAGIELFDVEVRNGKFIIGGKHIKEFFDYLEKNKLNLIEERIIQHDELVRIYPDSLNTIRVISFLKELGEVEILGTILRMGYDKSVDNFDAGGISVEIDLDGVIRKKAVVKNPIKNREFDKHPFTQSIITGAKIPYWDNVIKLVKNATKEVPEIRTVGWDVIISNEGVSLLEGNHNWDKTHWQLCYGKGMKKYIEELNKYDAR